MRRKGKKAGGLRNSAIITAYWQGVRDALARRPPRPPRSVSERRAYVNGYQRRG